MFSTGFDGADRLLRFGGYLIVILASECRLRHSVYVVNVKAIHGIISHGQLWLRGIIVAQWMPFCGFTRRLTRSTMATTGYTGEVHFPDSNGRRLMAFLIQITSISCKISSVGVSTH